MSARPPLKTAPTPQTERGLYSNTEAETDKQTDKQRNTQHTHTKRNKHTTQGQDKTDRPVTRLRPSPRARTPHQHSWRRGGTGQTPTNMEMRTMNGKEKEKRERNKGEGGTVKRCDGGNRKEKGTNKRISNHIDDIKGDEK